MKINGNEIRPGNVIEHNGALWVAVKTQAVKPGKGAAYAQVELKNVIDGTKLNERFRSSETVERVGSSRRTISSCSLKATCWPSWTSTATSRSRSRTDFLGERAAFLQDGMMVTVESYEGRPIGISLPDQVTLEVVEADPVVKGQTAASSYKPAMLENGVRILVPPFIRRRRAHRRRHQRDHLCAPRRVAACFGFSLSILGRSLSRPSTSDCWNRVRGCPAQGRA